MRLKGSTDAPTSAHAQHDDRNDGQAEGANPHRQPGRYASESELQKKEPREQTHRSDRRIPGQRRQ